MPATTFRCSSAWATGAHAAIVCALVCSASSAATPGRAYTLETYAADAGAAVFVDTVGALIPVKTGQNVADTGWRLVRIEADGVDVTAGQTINGDIVTVRIRRGERFSPEVLDGRIGAAVRLPAQAFPLKPVASERPNQRQRDR